MSLLVQAIWALVAQLKSRLAQLKKRHNFHRLPIEVLTEVFSHAARKGYADHCYYRQLARLSSVCTFWAGVIRHAPTLWTTIHARNEPRLIEKMITRSGNHPLLVYASGRGCNCNPPQPLEPFLKLLRTQAHRWQAAEFVVDNPRDDRYLQKYLTDTSAPQLKKLYVSVDEGYNSGNTAAIDLFRRGAGNLEELKLSGVAVPWTSALLSRLRILRLSHLNSGAALTTSGFFNILEQCPDLSELQIRHCRVSESDASDLPDQLELTHLRRLDVEAITPPISACMILSRISSPEFERFRFISDSGSATDDVLKNLSHLVPSLVHLVASARNVGLRLDDDGYRFDTLFGDPWMEHRYRPFELEISHISASPWAVLDWVTAHFGDAMKDVATGVDIFKRSLSKRDLAALGRIPLVTSLDLIGKSSQVLHFLSTSTLINGRDCWPLPHLAKLSITGHTHDPNMILHMVQSRYGHTLESKEAKSKARLPSPLTLLTICEDENNMYSGIYWGISEIVGRNRLRWYVDDEDYLETQFGI
ncbi:hypothetical protein FRB99_005271 [Tulasnella sp. 403]|nr:hypothetical protein FRB99_005271 [Tulasnella sp. 403]